MRAMLILAILIILFLSLFLWKVLRELANLNHQVESKQQTHANFTIVSDLHIKVINQLCDCLNQLDRELADSRIEKQKKERELKEMLAYIAHDVRTPLTSVQGYLWMLQEGELTEQETAYFDIINQRLDVIKEMLEQFFFYTKLLNEDYHLNRKLVHPTSICTQVLADFYTQLQAHSISLTLSFSTPSWEIEASPELLQQIFANLIQNAIHHGNGALSIIQQGTTICFTNPCEKGNEIDPTRLFERFYKGDTSRTTISSGLGLPIVKKAMELLHGEVVAEVEQGNFSICLRFPQETSKE